MNAIASLPDVVGFLSVVVAGVTISAQCLTIGGIGFLLAVVRPLGEATGSPSQPIADRTCRLMQCSAAALVLAQALAVALEAAMLTQSIGLDVGELWGANAIDAGIMLVGAAVMIALLSRKALGRGRLTALIGLALLVLGAQTAMSHAA